MYKKAKMGNDPTVIPPSHYGDRFFTAMTKYFIKVNWLIFFFIKSIFIFLFKLSTFIFLYQANNLYEFQLIMLSLYLPINNNNVFNV